MKPKRCIALWMLAVYLLMTVGPACASLSCRCTAMKARTETACGHHRSRAALVGTPDAAFFERVDDRRARFLCHGTVRCGGFRAPPARG